MSPRRGQERMIDPDTLTTTVRTLLARTIDRLETMDAPDEAIATLRPARRVGFIPRPAALDPVGRAWRLGVLLLDRDSRLFAIGGITRAIELTHETVYMNAEALYRRSLRVAATRGGFALGDAVNFDVIQIALDVSSLSSGSGPLSLSGGTVMVRWAAGVGDQGLANLETYFKERMDILAGD
ncbi:hypothetical protein [Frigoribacterium sp. CG_9.8]|uniref:hypothetical protein n=1 Tax=Frigoribacterium sp. CG_9.8 TaxID=2787733 RepID=UPI0018CAC61C|nr:hypothetical protein [Frigoribacterium sp. CG_9.8]MBG6107175.1 hypothetical protein [Frigoribacterium sp. CG_9.8]